MATRAQSITTGDAHPGAPRGPPPGMWCCRSVQAARRRTNQTVTAMSSADSASSQPPSIHWNAQNRLAGWYLVNCV